MGDTHIELSESFIYLKKSMDQLQNQQSGGTPPVLYPQVNNSETISTNQTQNTTNNIQNNNQAEE